jgi:hypothetical protein
MGGEAKPRLPTSESLPSKSTAATKAAAKAAAAAAAPETEGALTRRVSSLLRNSTGPKISKAVQSLFSRSSSKDK